MWDRYRDWIYAWETRLNARDTNRVVRPLDWGLDWTEHWPVMNGTREAAPADPAAHFAQLNQQIVSHSDDFYAYRTPSDFRLEGSSLLFTSPVLTPYAANNLVRARWFPSGPPPRADRDAAVERRRRRPRRAVPDFQHAGIFRSAPEPALPRLSQAGRNRAGGLRRFRQYRAHHRRRAPGRDRRARVPGLAGNAGVHGVRDCRHQPRFVLRFPDQCA